MKTPLFPLQYEPGIPEHYTERGSEKGAKLDVDKISVPDARRAYAAIKNLSLNEALLWFEENKATFSAETLLVDLAIGNEQRFEAFIRHYSGLKMVMLKRPLNTIFRVNSVLNMTNDAMEAGGYLFCHSRTSALKRQLILQNYPWGINHIVWAFHYLWHRVCPKLWLTKSLYFNLTKGRNRTFHRVEVLGRICRAGFEILDEEFRHGEFFVIARKVAKPIYDESVSGAPIIRLRRVGKNGKLIDVYKFRTMYSYSEYIQSYIYDYQDLTSGGKFADDYRVSHYGRFMRMFWIDELPMIWNILKGDLKLVGVRPLSTHYFNLYTPEMQQLRVKAKPGLLPPYYFEKKTPETLEEIQDSERRYTESYLKHPLWTDIRYFFGIIFNIVFRRKKSQ